jgi:F-type H+-transporting ATPase subunit a
MNSGINVKLAAEQIGSLWGLPITNTLLMSWVVIALLTIFALVVGTRVKLIPSRIQTLFEWLIEFIYDYISETLGSRERARNFLPFLMTLFLFIATANLIEFTPGIGSFGLWRGDEFVPLLRSVNSDLNVTLALAIIAVVVIEVAGVVTVGLRHRLGTFFNFRGKNIGDRLLNFVVGLIELVSEISRLVSFSFRLFGNIFAGEVLLAVATYFVPYVLPSFLMTFELFVGFVQAAVFALLTLFFIKLATTKVHH